MINDIQGIVCLSSYMGRDKHSVSISVRYHPEEDAHLCICWNQVSSMHTLLKRPISETECDWTKILSSEGALRVTLCYESDFCCFT